MPHTNSNPDSRSHTPAKRSLPTWMSSKENSNKFQQKQNDASEILQKSDMEECTATQNNLKFSRLLEGVVFVLSGFVNPERSTLRAQAVEMGAEYQPDWTSGCTLLVCAFPNTPKFRQVKTDNATIVSKEWISECYNHKKLVDIERYLMHVGKPWRRCADQNQPNKVKRSALSEEPIKRGGNRSLVMIGSASSEFILLQGGLRSSSDNRFLPSKIKEWVADDLSKTISWLESQDEKPEAIEIRRVAAEGVIACLQDAIDSVKQKKDIKTVTDQWMFVPRIVTYLAELEGGNRNGSLPKKELYELADSCKKIYESELKQLNISAEGKKYKNEDNEEYNIEPDDKGFDSDQTIEMTEEEIDLAFNQIDC